MSLAASGGEDYCLLLTVDLGRLQEIQKGFARTFGSPLYRIGHILPRDKSLVYVEQGNAIRLQKHGFDHFARKRK
jgi:thiamine-monophosphate kinase